MKLNKERIPLFTLLTVGILPSFLKILYYRFKGAKIGTGVRIAPGSVVIGQEIEIGDHCQIGFGTVIRGKKIRLGRFVEIGSFVYIDVDQFEIDEDSLIREKVLIGGLSTPDSAIKIGRRTHIRQNCYLNTSMPITIGDDSAIGGNSLIFTHSSWQSILDGYPCTFEPVSLGNNVWIGWDVFILPGVKIGDGSLVAAGSVVNRSVPEKSLARGNPAKVILASGQYPRATDSEERKQIFQKVLHEFNRHLEHNRIEFKIEENTASTQINMSLEENRFLRGKVRQDFSIIFLPDETENPVLLPKAAQCTFVSYNPIKPSLQASIQQPGTMWLDLAQLTRSGSNPVGEEFVHFVMRFGIRFRRVD